MKTRQSTLCERPLLLTPIVKTHFRTWFQKRAEMAEQELKTDLGEVFS